jgi:hypothetical protein
MREANADNNMALVHSNIFEKAKKFEDLWHIKDLIYRVPRQADFQVMKTLMECVERIDSTTAFCEAIYDEYFDHRMYLVEQYLDAVSSLTESVNVQNVSNGDKVVGVLVLGQVYGAFCDQHAVGRGVLYEAVFK